MIVAVHDQRRGLDADFQFIDHLVGLGVDFDDTVLVTPTVAIDVFAVLEVALVGNEQSGSRGVEILHGIAVVPLHAGG